MILLHDNAYADLVYGGKTGKSFLSYPGAMEVGIEFYSLSKSYNMTGMRISFAVGNARIIEEFKKVRSQIDYGIFLPVQYAAIAALTGPQDSVREQCRLYEERCRALCRGLTRIGRAGDHVCVGADTGKLYKQRTFCSGSDGKGRGYRGSGHSLRETGRGLCAHGFGVSGGGD